MSQHSYKQKLTKLITCILIITNNSHIYKTSLESKYYTYIELQSPVKTSDGVLEFLGFHLSFAQKHEEGWHWFHASGSDEGLYSLGGVRTMTSAMDRNV